MIYTFERRHLYLFLISSSARSVVYDPSVANMYVAYEEGDDMTGADANWRPAACQEYLWLNMTEWW